MTIQEATQGTIQTATSSVLLQHRTSDYEIKLMDIPDPLMEGKTTTGYGVFNRITGVREGFTNNLAEAVKGTLLAQEYLNAMLETVSKAKEAPSRPPGILN